MTAFVAAVVEAFSELRIHKTRVLLALLGVMLSVAALTSVVALGNMAEAGLVQSAERSAGRAATLGVSVYSPTGELLDPATTLQAYDDVAERYSVEYSSVRMDTSLNIRGPAGVVQSYTTVVDRDYGTMHRVKLAQGSWFTEVDEQRMAPAVVINEAFHQLLGSPDLVRAPGITIEAETPVRAVVVGVLADDYAGAMPQAYVLRSHAEQWNLASGQGVSPMLELWVPATAAEELTVRLQGDLVAQTGGQADVYRQDYASQGDPYAVVTLSVAGIAGLVLLLGAVGLLNISMVTVKYRVREIGIRRSFGATSGRIFFGVLMESVVATFVAGVAGVMLAVAVIKYPRVQALIGGGATDLPPFPIEAALIGIAAATAVGALAGLIPALVAVRVKVIDAIRY